MTLGEIAALVGGEVLGDATATVERISPIEEAARGSLTFISNKKYWPWLKKTEATGILCPRDLDQDGRPPGVTAVVVDNPYLAFARVMQKWHDEGPRKGRGVDARAFVGANVKLGADVTVHPFAYIDDDVVLGDRCVVHPFAHVGKGSKLGNDVVLHAGVVLYAGVTIGDRCIVHAHAVIGGDGFGYATDFSCFEHVKIPQVGTVVLEDDVEVGAGSTIDRAVLGETRIGRGTKIDNLVMVAHNVKTGMGCFLVSQSGISGSTRLGNFVTLAGQAGLVGHIEVGDGAIVGAQAGITNDVPPGARMLGSPAIPGQIARRYMAVLPRLPQVKRDVIALERRVAELEARLGIERPAKRARGRRVAADADEAPL
jgi:UDP-3-O-[3-hydroxymyristoyl] glucosamine N-acyltransferase